jgi:hypothetical protein
MENVIFKCYSEGDDNSLFITASLIKKIGTTKMVSRNSGCYPKLFVKYYDDEFCCESTFFCDYVEPMDLI